MEYIITADDIRRFPELQAFEGEPATPEEMAMMGVTPSEGPASPASADPTAGGDPAYTAARNAGFDVDEAVMMQDPATRAGPSINSDPSIYTQNVSMPSSVSSMGGAGGASSSMLDLLSTPVPQDPFENLSRNQRMMLGFAAMKDAGMALMGKDSSAVAGVMGDFTERANMERKRRAALAGLEAERQQRAALAGLFGGGDASGGYTPDLSTPDGVRAHIARLTQYAASNPEGAAGVVPEIQRLQGEVERITAAQGEVQSGQMMLGQLDALIFDPDLERALGIEGFLRRVPAELGLDSDTARVRARIDQIKGGAFLQAFESLKGGGQITEIEGQKAEQAEARLSTAQDLGDFAEALKEYRFYIDQGVRRKMGEDIPLDTLYRQEQPASGAGESLEDFKIRMGIKT